VVVSSWIARHDAISTLKSGTASARSDPFLRIKGHIGAIVWQLLQGRGTKA